MGCNCCDNDLSNKGHCKGDSCGSPDTENDTIKMDWEFLEQHPDCIQRIKITSDYYLHKPSDEQLIPCVIEQHYRDGDGIFTDNIFFIKPNDTFIKFKDYLFKEKLKTDLRIQPDAVSFYIYGNLEKRINTSEVADENIGAIYSNEVCISDCWLYMSYIVHK